MKKIVILLVFLVILSLAAIPVMAEERSVIGINIPTTAGIISYEKESLNNTSWTIGGFLYFTSANNMQDINVWLAGGRRYYNGDSLSRYYKGLYCTLDYKQNSYQPDPQSIGIVEGGIAGVFGYEWRFGATKNPRFYFEGGFKASYSTDAGRGFNVYPVIGSGFGFNI